MHYYKYTRCVEVRIRVGQRLQVKVRSFIFTVMSLNIVLHNKWLQGISSGIAFVLTLPNARKRVAM